jgi:predicted ATPase/class 3 adenylate cyclase
MSSLPTGTVTFLFTDIEGNTPLWERDPMKMDAAMQIHNAILRQAIEANGGMVFQIVGDEFQAAFPTAPQALIAAIEAQRELLTAHWNDLGALRVRMGIHTGEAHLDERGDDYAVSHTKNRGHRVMEAGNGGQILLSQESSDLCKRGLPPEVILKDLGEYHIRNLKLPERFYQVVASDLPKDFPPLRTQAEPKHNLPIQLTSFIGRRQEIRKVENLLKKNRLVTLTGPGGTGKTRLSLQVAEELLEYYLDGVWLVELGRLADPDLLTQAAANALGMHLSAGPQTISFLIDYLQSKSLLLIFDNCEHLIDSCARLSDALLRACPNLSILATSREALAIEGETSFRVPPLTFPKVNESLENLTQFEAIRLFAERAGATSPGFQITEENAPAITQVCQRLDGIPLAIELAAARLKLLSAEEIAIRLDDRFRLLTGGSRTALPRYQTLRASVDWSYELLTPVERVLLQHLSVFAGSWTLEAAEFVGCGEDIESWGVLDLIGQLVDKSLVSIEPVTLYVTRYRMLETIRQYAQEKLVEARLSEPARQRHLEYYLDLAERVEFNFHGPKYAATSERLETELDNIRLALGWCLEGRCKTSWDPEPGLRLVSALGDYWYFCGHLDEGFQCLERLLVSEAEQRGTQPISTQRAKWRAKALQVAGNLAIWLRDFDKAFRMSEESRDLFRELGPEGRRGYALALENLGWLGQCGNFDLPMEALLAEAEAIFREIGDDIQENECRLCKGIKAILNNDLDLAKLYLEEDLAFRKGIGDLAGAANTLRWLGEFAFLLDDWEKAKILYNESQDLFLQAKSIYDYLYLLLALGYIECSQGKYDQVAQYYQEVLDLACKQGEISAIQSAGSSLGNLALLQGNYEEAARIFEQNLVFMRKHDHPAYVALSLIDLGYLAWEKGDYQGAEQKFDEGSAILQKIGGNQFEPNALSGSGRVAFAQGEYDQAREFFDASLELQQVTYTRNIPDNLEALAYVEAGQDNDILATHLLGATQAWYQKYQYTRTPKEHEMRKNAVASLLQTLGGEAFAAAWEEGSAMTLERVVAYALEDHEYPPRRHPPLN